MKKILKQLLPFDTQKLLTITICLMVGGISILFFYFEQKKGEIKIQQKITSGYTITPPLSIASGLLTTTKKEQRFIEGETETFRYRGFDPRTYAIDLYRYDENKKPYYDFRTLRDALFKKGKKLIFAINAGIYNTNREPEGLHIENGRILQELNTKTGEGNFYLLPNGIFFVTFTNKAAIYKTREFKLSWLKREKEIRLATQSGPLLVHQNLLHPLLRSGATSVFIRSGVGVGKNGMVYFVLSKKKVNLYELADFFKTYLSCPNALYLDGEIPRVYTEKNGSEQTTQRFVGILGITQDM